ncbi:MAG: HD domain-containing protein [Bacillota bacterium]|jgi:putative nucleotidyltransferase with HDIG domain|nr:HD domain-containing protein [Bacillota bacterium]NLV62883.1 HD domain-containing protein [Clostridiaceae bacterium]
MITLDDVKKNEEVNTLLCLAQKQLEIRGFTEHSFRHVGRTANTAGNILKKLGHSSREVELARIAGYLHDIGNAVNRENHAHIGAYMAYDILTKMGMGYDEAGEIMQAIGNHDESSGTAVSNVSAALILADKSDVHRSRVTNSDITTFDIHDRVNYAVVKSGLIVDADKKVTTLQLDIDTVICPVMDYFEIFLDRMKMNRRAAEFLGLKFELVINKNQLL